MFCFVLSEWKVTKKKKGCPAVTLITQVQSVTISLDVVLSLMVKSSWPPFTKEGLKIEGWLGTKVKQEYKRMPYYLVPKYEGKGTVENDGVLAKGKSNFSQLVNQNQIVSYRNDPLAVYISTKQNCISIRCGSCQHLE